jgi:hypothetical protein
MAETDDMPEPREPGPDRRDNVASAGLDPDTWRDLEAWRVDRRLKRSEATRRLLRAGLRGASGQRRPILIGGTAAGAGFALIYALNGTTVALAVVGGIYIAATILWALAPYVTSE